MFVREFLAARPWGVAAWAARLRSPVRLPSEPPPPVQVRVRLEFRYMTPHLAGPEACGGAAAGTPSWESIRTTSKP